MSLVLVVANTPNGIAQVKSLEHLQQMLGVPPDGVQRLADNVWLIDVENSQALDFLLKFPKIAEDAGQKFQAVSIPPKTPTAMQPTPNPSKQT
jgi:hypothetical protein